MHPCFRTGKKMVKFELQSESLLTLFKLNAILLEYLKFISVNAFFCQYGFPLFRLNSYHLLEHIKQIDLQAVFAYILVNVSVPSLLFGRVSQILTAYVFKESLFFLHCTSLWKHVPKKIQVFIRPPLPTTSKGLCTIS